MVYFYGVAHAVAFGNLHHGAVIHGKHVGALRSGKIQRKVSRPVVERLVEHKQHVLAVGVVHRYHRVIHGRSEIHLGDGGLFFVRLIGIGVYHHVVVGQDVVAAVGKRYGKHYRRYCKHAEYYQQKRRIVFEKSCEFVGCGIHIMPPLLFVAIVAALLSLYTSPKSFLRSLCHKMSIPLPCFGDKPYRYALPQSQPHGALSTKEDAYRTDGTPTYTTVAAPLRQRVLQY